VTLDEAAITAALARLPGWRRAARSSPGRGDRRAVSAPGDLPEAFRDFDEILGGAAVRATGKVEEFYARVMRVVRAGEGFGTSRNRQRSSGRSRIST
jgi:hypothetical protein